MLVCLWYVGEVVLQVWLHGGNAPARNKFYLIYFVFFRTTDIISGVNRDTCTEQYAEKLQAKAGPKTLHQAHRS